MQVNGEIIVGKTLVSQKACWVPYNGGEIGNGSNLKFQVLTTFAGSDLQIGWRQVNKGDPIPTGMKTPFPAGRKLASGIYLDHPERYFLGKCQFNGEWTPGAIHEKSMRMFVPWGGGAHECDVFQLLSCYYEFD